jgi:alpha-L-fucosidase
MFFTRNLRTAFRLGVLAITGIGFTATPPAPVMPVPSVNQLAWHKSELMLMASLSLETYAPGYAYNCGPCVKGNHCEQSPTLFNPDMFDANQWVAAAQAGGFKEICVMAKHFDGFCTWQTRTTRYSVVSSPWRGGKGDIVKDMADACHAAGLKFGVYLGPWDLHYCDSEKVNFPTYAQYFNEQLRELLTNYGTVDEVWFDGAMQETMGIDWESVYLIILSLQPSSVTFQGFWITDTGRIRIQWIGNEDGLSSEMNWCITPQALPDSNLYVPSWAEWYDKEADVSLQGMWFWEDWRKVASLDQFKNVYLRSVGLNAVAMINIAPNPSGLIDTEAVNRLTSFKAWVDSIYSCNIVAGKNVTASSVRENDTAAFGPANAIDTAYDTYWAPDSMDTLPKLEVDLNGYDTISKFFIQEYMPLGQRVASHTIQTWDGSQWNTVRNTTRWCACDGNVNHWWKVDLGSAFDINGSRTIWETPGHAYKYKVETSSDDATYTLAVDKTANTDTTQIQTDYFTVNARYVRITVTGLDAGRWASFYEFKVLGNSLANLALNKSSVADCEQNGHPASQGNDDLMGEGITIGFKRIYNLPNPIVASKVRLIVNRSRAFPLINNFGIVGTHVTIATKWGDMPLRRQEKITITGIRSGHIRLLGQAAGVIVLELVRMDGRTIKRQRFLNASGTMDFSIPPHASGIYILKASIGGRVTNYATVFLQ